MRSISDRWVGTAAHRFIYAAVTVPVREKQKNPGEWRAFGSCYHDWRQVLQADNRSLSQRQQDMGNICIGI